jgi:hypothetical protein
VNILDQIDRTGVFVYYPEYNPFRKLGLDLPIITMSDKPFRVKPSEANDVLDEIIACYRQAIQMDQPPTQNAKFC